MLTVAATYIRCAPTTAVLSVFVVLGAVVLGQTIAGGNEGVWTALGYTSAGFLLIASTWLGLRYLRRRG
jgi:hypothetical protein